MAKKSKGKNKIRLNRRFRISIFSDGTHEKLYTFRCNGLAFVIKTACAAVALLAAVTLLFFYTPLREAIPGYPTAQTRRDIVRNALLADSLQNEINIWRLQFANIQRIVNGEAPMAIDSILALPQLNDSLLRLTEAMAKDDSLLRETVRREDRLGESLKQTKIEQIEGLHFFPPVRGMVTQEFNPAVSHPYVDIAAAENSVVSATLDGTVISAYYDRDAGYVIHIQHDNNLVSIYKHNAKLIKETGDKVSAGTPISLVGNTGRLSTAPHLHFELWYRGEPVNPAEYINF